MSGSGPKVLLAIATMLATQTVGCDRQESLTTPDEGIRQAGFLVAYDSVRDVPAYTMSLPAIPRAFDLDGDSLETALRAAGGLAFIAFKSPGSLRAFSSSGQRGAVSAATVREGLLAFRAAGGEVLNVYGNAAMAYVKMPSGVARTMRQHPLVDFVEPRTDPAPSERLTTWVEAAGAALNSNAALTAAQVTPWNITFVQGPQGWQYSTGNTAKVMLMGTGLTLPQPDLPAVPGGNCGGAFNSCSSEFLDGTAQAAVIMALNNTSGIVGLAHGIPAANIYSWRIYLADGTVSGDLYAVGLNQAISLGAKTLLIDLWHTNYLAYEANLIASAWASGIVTVSHVGSGGAYYGTAYPASLANVVGVSGVRQDSAFAGNPTAGCTHGGVVGSNWGPMVKLAAPFWAYTLIPYAGGGGGIYVDTKAFMGYCRTSLSAAHVAGIVALLQDEYPAWTPTQIVQELTSTASHPISQDPYIGYGIPNASKALWPYPPLVVTVAGPSEISTKATYTWEAMPSGGPPGQHTYQWAVFYDSGTNYNLGTQKTQSMTVFQADGSFTMQVTVTKGSITTVATLYVENCIGGGCGIN